jgi:hypothetical protein
LFGAGEQNPGAEQFQMQPRGGGTCHLSEGRVSHIRCPGKLSGAQIVGLVPEARDLVRRHAAEDGLSAFRHGLYDDEVPEPLQKVLHKPPGIVPRLDDTVHSPKDRGGVRGRYGIDDVVKQGCVRVTQQRHRQLIVKTVGSGACHELVQDRQRVTDGPAPRADDQ